MTWSKAAALVLVGVVLGVPRNDGGELLAQDEAVTEADVPVELVEAFFPVRMAQHLPRGGAWLPLYVELRNKGDRVETVTIEAITQTENDKEKIEDKYTTRSRFEVNPGNARTRAWLYVWAETGDRAAQLVSLRFISGGRPVPIGVVGDNGRVILDSDRDGILPIFSVGSRDTRTSVAPWGRELSRNSSLSRDRTWTSDAVEALAVEALPDRVIGYNAVRLVILRGNAASNLEPAQRAALQEWVFLGGSVVFVPANKSGKVFESRLFKDLVRADVRAEKIRKDEDFQPRYLYYVERKTAVRGREKCYIDPDVTLLSPERRLVRVDPFVDSKEIIREIRSYGRESFHRRPGVAEGDSIAGLDLENGEYPGERLYAEVAYGDGHVGTLTIDHEEHSFSDSVLLRQGLWQKIVLSGAVRGAEKWRVEMVNNAVHDALEDRKRDVGVFLIGAIIVAYLLIVGPGVYFLLKRKSRLPSIIWVEPVVIVAYVGVIFAFGYLTKGYLTKGRMITLYHQRVGEPYAVRDSYLSIFSADDVEYQIESPHGETLSPVFANPEEVDAVEIAQGQRGGVGSGGGKKRRLVLRGYALDLWQQGVVRNSGVAMLGGSIKIDPITVDGSTTYRIKNELPWGIQGAWLSPRGTGRRSVSEGFRVGAIPSGASIEVDPGAASLIPQGEGDSPITSDVEWRFGQLANQGVSYGRTPLLWALLDREEMDFRVDRAFKVSQKLDFFVLYD